MFQEPETKNGTINRSYNGEGEISYDVNESKTSDIYQLPQRKNSEHNRGVDGELSDSTWPPEWKTDPWHKGIEEVTVNSNDAIATRDCRLSAVARDMWEL